MPLAYRIAAGFSIVLAVMLALAIYHLNLFHRQSVETLQLVNTSGPAMQATEEIRTSLIELDELAAKIPAYAGLEEPGEPSTAVPGYQERIAGLRASLAQNIEILSDLDLSGELQREVFHLTELLVDFLEEQELGNPESFLEVQPPDPGSLALPLLAPIQRQIEQVQRVSRASSIRQQAVVIRNTRRANLAAQLAAVIGLLAALAGSLLVGRSILRPVRRVARGARALAEGDFTYRVPETGGKEMVALARDFNLMAARISELDQLKKDLVSNVSHDLKAPLASMQETTRLLLEELPGPLNAQQLRLLHLNSSSGERLSRMISDLLDLSRLEAGVEAAAFEKINFGSMLRTAVEELENLLKEREQTFRLELPQRLVEVEGQPSALSQVLTNLLSNAWKFTPRGGALGARLEGFEAAKEEWRRRLPPSLRQEVGHRARAGSLLEVWDSGPGVPAQHRERIFQRFHRVDSHRKGAQGTGLGLAIAAAIAAQHHGALWVEDRPEGGSSFKLLLWQRIPPEESPPETGP